MDRPQDKRAAPRRRASREQSGSTLLEFALASLVYIPLTLGVVGLGLSLGSYITALQTTRDSAHMFARGIDFASDANKDIVVRLAAGLNLTRTSGNGSVVFSKIITPTEEDCAAAGLSSSSCRNQGSPVVTHRVRLGDNSRLTSHYGTPAASLISSEGNIAASDYLTNSTVLAGSFAAEATTAGLVQERGEIAYLVEGYFTVPSLMFLGYATGGMYCRFLF
jgi:hypothetical protein